MIEVQQALDSFDVLDLIVKNLSCENSVLKSKQQRRINEQEERQNRYLPKRELGTQVGR
jgi:FtsZ-binding cell division protein ZapB